jgi:hypothetical protein
MRSKLNGYKTYLVGVITALLGIYNVVRIGHFSTASVAAFVAAGGLASLRAAIAKVEKALAAKK